MGLCLSSADKAVRLPPGNTIFANSHCTSLFTYCTETSASTMLYILRHQKDSAWLPTRQRHPLSTALICALAADLQASATVAPASLLALLTYPFTLTLTIDTGHSRDQRRHGTAPRISQCGLLRQLGNLWQESSASGHPSGEAHPCSVRICQHQTGNWGGLPD